MKNTIPFSLFFLILFFTQTIQAQDNPLQQTVLLIDGSLLKAQVLDRGTEFTKIKIISGDVLLLNNNLIQQIGGEGLVAPAKVKRSPLHAKGTYSIISMGVLLGRDAELEEDLAIGISALHYVAGYQFNQYIGVGAGLGFDYYNHNFIPAYADFRGNFTFREKVLFYSLQAGYAFTSDDFGSDSDTQYSGGLMLYPAIGLRFPTQLKTDILLEFGFRNQWAKREYSWRNEDDNIIFSRYAFRVGFAF